MLRRETVLGHPSEGAVGEPEQRQRRPADEVDMGVERAQREILAGTHPDARRHANGRVDDGDKYEVACDPVRLIPPDA